MNELAETTRRAAIRHRTMVTEAGTKAALDIVRNMRTNNPEGLKELERKALEVLARPVCDAFLRGAAHAVLGAIVATETGRE